MSDQPATNTDDKSHAGDVLTALRDVRWLSGLIWIGLLAALLVTSVYGITAFTQGSLAARYLALPTNAVQAGSDTSHRVAIAGLIASGLAVVTLALAWLQFARATRSLVVAYASEDGDPETSPVAAEWVTDESTPGGTGTRTRVPVADVLLYLGATWAVLILTPAFLNAVSSFGMSNGITS